MAGAGGLFADLLLEVMNGRPLKDAVLARIDAQDHPIVGHPFRKWLNDPDDWVIGPKLSTACYVEHSVPAVLFLALKYHNDPEKALVVNTNLGGDNVYRGGVLGALLGAEHGKSGFPRRWVDGLLDPPPALLPPVE
jgi:hypothetical protein